MACQHVRNCQYYIYDTFMKGCQLLDSSSRQCDLIQGSKDSTAYNTCDAHCIAHHLYNSYLYTMDRALVDFNVHFLAIWFIWRSGSTRAPNEPYRLYISNTNKMDQGR